MEVNQIYDLVNDALKQSIGEEEVLSQDLSNLTALGEAVFNNKLVDKYVGSLMNKIAATKFVNRKYTGNIPSIMVEEYEFGSIINKIDIDLLEATENESSQLEKGTAIVPTFNPPKVNEKFYHLKDNTYEIDISIAENQVKQSFRSATELNSFISIIQFHLLEDIGYAENYPIFDEYYYQQIMFYSFNLIYYYTYFGLILP